MRRRHALEAATGGATASAGTAGAARQLGAQTIIAPQEAARNQPATDAKLARYWLGRWAHWNQTPFISCASRTK